MRETQRSPQMGYDSAVRLQDGGVRERGEAKVEYGILFGFITRRTSVQNIFSAPHFPS